MGIKAMRALVGVVLFSAALLVHAQQQCTQYRVWWGNKEGKAMDRESACAQLVGAENPSPSGLQTVVSTSVSDGLCRLQYTSSWGESYNGTGYAGFEETQVPCGNVCEASTTPAALNVTVGYVRNSGDVEGVVVFNPGAPGATACNDGCSVSFGNVLEYLESKARASNGMYRVSYTMETYSTGAACAGTDDALNSQPTNVPPCKGSLGTVNGQPYCAGTAQDPVANDKPLPPSPVPPSSGNPTAGTGQTNGSSPTPATGGGGPEGGPASAAGPGRGNGDGTVPTPAPGTQQQNCGAPGQPKCSIDESGTPRDGAAKFVGPDKEVQDGRDGVLDLIEEAKTLEAPAWTWTFQLPTACSPYYMAAFDLEIDMCRWQSVIHDLMSLVWIAATIWGCIGVVNRTMAGG